MRDVPLIDRIVQIFMVGFSGTCADEQLIPLMDRHKLTSFILFKNNVRDFAGMRSMTESARRRACSEGLPRPLFAADEEGGLISPLGAAVGRLPSAMALAAGNSRERARRAAALIGGRLKRAGLDLVLAPVLDVNSAPGNPVIGTRSFGDSQLSVAAYGAAMIEGFRSAGLLSCAKHFPGHGRASEDSHKTLPVVEASAEEMLGADLVPFYRACRLEVDAAMTAHVAYPGLDDAAERPATLSKRIQTGILRHELKFKGTLLSDSMEMKGLAESLAPEDACVQALKAGVDMFICVDPQLALRCASRIVGALDEGDLKAETLERALANVAGLKEKAAGVSSGSTLKTIYPPGVQDKMAERAPADANKSAGRPPRDSDEIENQSLWAQGEDEPAMLQSTLDDCYAESITAVNCVSAVLKRRLASVNRGLLLVPDGLPGYDATDPYLLGIGLVALGVSDRWQVLMYPHDPSEDDVDQIMTRAGNCEGIVLCALSRGPEPPGQRALAGRVLRTGRLKLGVALLDPYSLERLFSAGTPGLATYGFWPECLRPLAEVLFGDRQASGVIPVDI